MTPPLSHAGSVNFSFSRVKYIVSAVKLTYPEQMPVVTHKYTDIVFAVATFSQGHVAAVSAEIYTCVGEDGWAVVILQVMTYTMFLQP